MMNAEVGYELCNDAPFTVHIEIKICLWYIYINFQAIRQSKCHEFS